MEDKRIELEKLYKIGFVLICNKLKGLKFVDRDALKTYLTEEEINYIYDLYFDLQKENKQKQLN